MTTFQLLALLVFAGVVLAAYGKDIYGWVKTRLPKLPEPGVNPAKPVTPDEPTGDVLVDDLLDIAALRDRFEDEGCTEGVEACSLLLKILIDHKHPHAG
jgi:hypothetical protein